MNNDELYKEIDKDIGLKSKRALLTTVSLIFLAIQFSGATIKEANTFILKLEFAHQNGMTLFLALGIIFLLIRYYNYARPYHSELSRIWRSKLTNDWRINRYDHYAHELTGLLHLKYPERYPGEAVLHDEKFNATYEYECKFLFVRNFLYHWTDEYDSYTERLNILKSLGISKYLFVLKLEFKIQFSRFFTHRENLDILSPYMLGALAVLSYIFNNEIHRVIGSVLSN